MYSLETPHRGGSNEYIQRSANLSKIEKDTPKLSLVSWPNAMSNSKWLELPMSRSKEILQEGEDPP